MGSIQPTRGLSLLPVPCSSGVAGLAAGQREAHGASPAPADPGTATSAAAPMYCTCGDNLIHGLGCGNGCSAGDSLLATCSPAPAPGSATPPGSPARSRCTPAPFIHLTCVRPLVSFVHGICCLRWGISSSVTAIAFGPRGCSRLLLPFGLLLRLLLAARGCWLLLLQPGS